MLTIEQIGRKQIYLDAQTLQNLRGLRNERLTRGLTQNEISCQIGIPLKTWRLYEYGKSVPTLERYVRLSEYFNWDMKNNPNCIYYQMAQRRNIRKWLMTRRIHYGYELKELSEELKISDTSIENAIYQRENASLNNFGLLYELFTEEQRQEKFRDELLKQKVRRQYDGESIKRV